MKLLKFKYLIFITLIIILSFSGCARKCTMGTQCTTGEKVLDSIGGVLKIAADHEFLKSTLR